MATSRVDHLSWLARLRDPSLFSQYFVLPIYPLLSVSLYVSLTLLFRPVTQHLCVPSSLLWMFLGIFQLSLCFSEYVLHLSHPFPCFASLTLYLFPIPFSLLPLCLSLERYLKGKKMEGNCTQL